MQLAGNDYNLDSHLQSFFKKKYLIGRRGGGRAPAGPVRPQQRSPSHSSRAGTLPYNPGQYQIDHRSVSQADSRSPQSSFRTRSRGPATVTQTTHQVVTQQRSYKTSLGHQSMI